MPPFGVAGDDCIRSRLHASSALQKSSSMVNANGFGVGSGACVVVRLGAPPAAGAASSAAFPSLTFFGPPIFRQLPGRDPKERGNKQKRRATPKFTIPNNSVSNFSLFRHCLFGEPKTMFVGRFCAWSELLRVQYLESFRACYSTSCHVTTILPTVP